jgi:hypothetical protein
LMSWQCKPSYERLVQATASWKKLHCDSPFRKERWLTG